MAWLGRSIQFCGLQQGKAWMAGPSQAKPGHDGGALSLRQLKRLFFRRALVWPWGYWLHRPRWRPRPRPSLLPSSSPTHAEKAPSGRAIRDSTAASNQLSRRSNAPCASYKGFCASSQAPRYCAPASFSSVPLIASVASSSRSRQERNSWGRGRQRIVMQL